MLVKLLERSENKCELCSATGQLAEFPVEPFEQADVSNHALLCQTCRGQLQNIDSLDSNHWRCLNDSMWNPNPAVQVLAYRLLHAMQAEGWPQDLLEMLYLDEETREWADKGLISGAAQVKHMDSNGVLLQAGDSVTLIKDLNVKGAGFTAKRGTAVRNISLVLDNPEQIEGKVNGQQIVILCQYVKKNK